MWGGVGEPGHHRPHGQVGQLGGLSGPLGNKFEFKALEKTAHIHWLLVQDIVVNLLNSPYI
jgi:hypothetical protein